MFIDEAQDTSDSQMKVISKITENNSEIIVQNYGDPYQSLYNLDGDSPDAWKPDEETSPQISLSNRFGDRIATVLRTTCVAPYPILQGNPSINSQKSHVFVYSEERRNQVLSKYAETLKQISKNNSVIPLESGKICAVSSHHVALNQFYAGYEKGLKLNSKVSLQKQCLYEFQKMLYNMLDEKITNNSSFSGSHSLKEFIKEFEDKRMLSSNLNLRTFLVVWMKNIKNSHSMNFKDFEKELINWFKERYLIDVSSEDMLSRISGLEKQIQKILNFETGTTAVQDNINDHDGIQINLNTIHGVKGETHCATLLLESNFYRDGLHGTDVTDVLDYMAGEFDQVLCTDPNINKSLKLAYVAFSRPRYFVGVAFNKTNVSVEQIGKLERSGWEIVEV
ncbi:UvrD-helicase domain-containing protein [Paenibacillus sp. EKM208P]|nr:UvrD-helicase domain-containing protein [Paenibacillus sp. EKM208P]